MVFAIGGVLHLESDIQDFKKRRKKTERQKTSEINASILSIKTRLRSKPKASKEISHGTDLTEHIPCLSRNQVNRRQAQLLSTSYSDEHYTQYTEDA